MAMRFRIATRIFALAVTLLALTVALSAFGAWMTHQLRSDMSRFADEYQPLQETLNEVGVYTFKRQLAFQQLLALVTLGPPDPRELDHVKTALEDYRSHIDASILFGQSQ